MKKNYNVHGRRIASLKDLRYLAKLGELYYVRSKPIAMEGTRASYEKYRKNVEETYDYLIRHTHGKVKPGELPSDGAFLRNYRSMYFLIDTKYRWMILYCTKDLHSFWGTVYST